MKRRLLQLLTVLSLVLWLAALTSWVRGHRVGDALQVAIGSGERATTLTLTSAAGAVRLSCDRVLQPGAGAPQAGAGEPADSRFRPVGWSYWSIDTPEIHFYERSLRAGNVRVTTDARGVGFAVVRAEFGAAPAPVFAHWGLSVPNWALLLLFGALPAEKAWRYVRHGGRRRPGACPSCGYDLRATPERCPECGAAGGRRGPGTG